MRNIFFLLSIAPLSISAQWQGTNPVYFNAGNVGIGTASPSAKLDIVGSGGGSIDFRVSGRIQSNSTDGGVWLSNATDGFVGNNSQNIGFWTSGSGIGWSAFQINKSNGFVGMGTIQPQQRLHVKNGAFMASDASFDNINLRADGTSVPALRFTRWIGSGSIQHNAFVGQFYNSALSGEYSFGIGTGYAADGNQDFNNKIITATLSGTVGIGTVTPQAKLDIQSDVGNSALRIQGGNPYGSYYLDIKPFLRSTPWSVGYSFNLKSSNGNFNDVLSLMDDKVGIGTTTPVDKLTVVGKQGLGIPGSSSGQLSFYPNNASSWFHIDHRNDNTLRISQGGSVGQIDLMTIVNNGNVGIGTTTPGSFKLAVEGKIWAKEVQVALTNPGPDYVFEPTYHLKPLSEIETYIKENKHLPEVPSAKEMEVNGVQLGEMNMLLLKKVEELTLYVIELKKENSEAKEMNKRLADKIDKIENNLSNKK
jgi:hypothetical protein